MAMNKECRTFLKGSQSIKPRRNIIQAGQGEEEKHGREIMWWQIYHKSPAQARRKDTAFLEKGKTGRSKTRNDRELHPFKHLQGPHSPKRKPSD